MAQPPNRDDDNYLYKDSFSVHGGREVDVVQFGIFFRTYEIELAKAKKQIIMESKVEGILHPVNVEDPRELRVAAQSRVDRKLEGLRFPKPPSASDPSYQMITKLPNSKNVTLYDQPQSFIIQNLSQEHPLYYHVLFNPGKLHYELIDQSQIGVIGPDEALTFEVGLCVKETNINEDLKLKRGRFAGHRHTLRVIGTVENPENYISQVNGERGWRGLIRDLNQGTQACPARYLTAPIRWAPLPIAQHPWYDEPQSQSDREDEKKDAFTRLPDAIRNFYAESSKQVVILKEPYTEEMLAKKGVFIFGQLYDSDGDGFIEWDEWLQLVGDLICIRNGAIQTEPSKVCGVAKAIAKVIELSPEITEAIADKNGFFSERQDSSSFGSLQPASCRKKLSIGMELLALAKIWDSKVALNANVAKHLGKTPVFLPLLFDPDLPERIKTLRALRERTMKGGAQPTYGAAQRWVYAGGIIDEKNRKLVEPERLNGHDGWRFVDHEDGTGVVYHIPESSSLGTKEAEIHKVRRLEVGEKARSDCMCNNCRRGRLKKEKKKTRECGSGGNCLFHVIGHKLFSDTSRHLEIRERACAWMRELHVRQQHEENFTASILGMELLGKPEDLSPTYDWYTTKYMNQSGTYAAELEIIAVANAYEVNIRVYNAGGDPHFFPPFAGPAQRTIEVIHFPNSGGASSHYQAIVGEDEEDEGVNETTNEELMGTLIKLAASGMLDGPKISLFVEQGFLSTENAEFLVRMSQSASREPYS